MADQDIQSLLQCPLLRVVGNSLHARVEIAIIPERIDHVWIRVDPGVGERVLISVNTLSKRNIAAGFDGRIRLGSVRGSYTALPERGVFVEKRLDYADLESRHNVFYEYHSRPELEKILLQLSRSAVMLEAWGAPYHRRHIGLHQIHSRRTSCAVPEDIRGLDGALRFYNPDGATTMLLMKFCGQP